MMAVILAGGGGTRLWPLSRAARPKQFTALLTEESLLRDTYRRLLRLIPAEKVFAVAGPDFAELVALDLPELADRIIVEPERKDTGPAMRYAAEALAELAPDEPMVFIPSDHYIGDEEMFLRCLALGEKIVNTRRTFADIGIAPSFPSTGLGYTRVGELVMCEDGIDAFTFRGHTEKPAYEVAKAYMEDGSYLWHANYYMGTPRMFLEACDTYAPEILRGEKVSFDRVVTERMPAAAMTIIKGTFPWSDVGTWDALHERLSPGNDNVVRGDAVLEDVKGSLVFSTAGRTVTVVGLEDIVVVDTPDALLITRKDMAPRVKDLVTRLSNERPHLI